MMYYYHLILKSSLNFISCPNNVLSSKRIQLKSCIACHTPSLQSPSILNNFSFSLIFMTLTSEDYRLVIQQNVPQFGLVWCFLMVKGRLCLSQLNVLWTLLFRKGRKRRRRTPRKLSCPLAIHSLEDIFHCITHHCICRLLWSTEVKF